MLLLKMVAGQQESNATKSIKFVSYRHRSRLLSMLLPERAMKWSFDTLPEPSSQCCNALYGDSPAPRRALQDDDSP